MAGRDASAPASTCLRKERQQQEEIAMPTTCTVSDPNNIATGDAVCVVGYDNGNSRPKVAQATAANSATSKTVFGVCVAGASDTFPVSILVAGEVAKESITSLGAGDSRVIATDINQAAAADQCRLVRVDRPDGSEHVVGTCDENGHTALHPRASLETSPQHVFNVKSYGAVGDGATDDAPAIAAALAAMDPTRPGTLYFPPGTYLHDGDLVIRHACLVTGAGSGTADLPGSTITFPAGNGIIVDDLPAKSAAKYTAFRHLYLVGSQLTLADRTDDTTPVKGTTLIRSPRHDDNRYYFKCVVAGTIAGTAPDFRNAYVPDRSVEYADLPTNVEAGTCVRNLGTSKTRFWECLTAGTKGTEPTWDTTVSAYDPVMDIWSHTTSSGGGGTAVWITRDGSGIWLDDGTATWACMVSPGIWARTQIDVRECQFLHFTNAGVHVQHDNGNVDLIHIERLRIVECGVGIALRGYDGGQGSTILSCLVTGPGYGGPWSGVGAANGVDTTGGHGIWDGSYLGANIIGCAVESQSGYAYIIGRFDAGSDGGSNPVGGSVIACYAEAGGLGSNLATGGVVVGGDVGPFNLGSGTIVLGGAAAHNITGRDISSAKHAASLLNVQGTDASFMMQNDDNGSSSSLSTAYEPAGIGSPGWWARNFGFTYVGRMFSGATADEGMGWEWMPFGEYRGGSGATTTNRYFMGLDPSAFTTHRKKNNHWEVGDRFEVLSDGISGGWVGYIVKTAGYRAGIWTPDKDVAVGSSLVEPTANFTSFPIPPAGSKVFKCHTAGHTDATTEPDWSTATLPGDLVNEVSGTAVWELLGFVPEYNPYGRIDDVSGVTGTLHAAVFDSSGTWTAPAAVSEVILIGYGGGGGGGGGSGGAGNGVLDTFPCGGGGGGGSPIASRVVSVTPSATYAITIGDGGAGGAGGGSNSDGSDGDDGGDTTFGSLAVFKGATGGKGGSRALHTSPAVYLLAAGGGAPGALRPDGNLTGFSDPFRTFATGHGSGGEGTDNQSAQVARHGTASNGGFAGGSGNLGGADASTYRGGGPGGGGGAGPGGQGGNAGTGGAGAAGTGSAGAAGDSAGPLGISANTGGGGGGGGAGGSSDSGHSGANGGAGGDGGSGKLTILYVV